MKNHKMKTIWLDVKAGWKQALPSYNTKTLYFSNSEHYISGLIKKHLHTKLKRISVKQTLTELRQKFWLCQSRDFVWKVLKNCFLCRKHEVPLFQSPLLWEDGDYLSVTHFTQPESIVLARCM